MRGKKMILKVDKIYKSFKDSNAVRDLSFEVQEGEILALIGKSGAGKTTALRCICGLERCDRGSITIAGEPLCVDDGSRSEYSSSKNIVGIRNKVGMVFQGFNLFPHLTVLENIIEAPTRVRGISKDIAVRNAMDLLGKLDLKEKANAYPFELSGGQKQRVAIARACILEPKLICFDEPTSALDPGLRDDIAGIIRSLAKEQGLTVLIITHDMGFARKTADEIIFMKDGEASLRGNTQNFFEKNQNTEIGKFIAS